MFQFITETTFQLHVEIKEKRNTYNLQHFKNESKKEKNAARMCSWQDNKKKRIIIE